MSDSLRSRTISRKRLWLGRVLIATTFFLLGMLLSGTDVGQKTKQATSELGTALLHKATERVARHAGLDARRLIFLEHPSLAAAIMKGGAFGGKYSTTIAQDMFTHTGKGIEDAKALTEIRQVAPRTWFIRLPIVNSVLFETDEGLVLVDTGMGVGGAAILEAIRKVSSKPLHTIIYTHGHVDHSYGTWALIEAGEHPEIIAHENIIDRFNRYIRLRGSLAQYMSQPIDSLPRTKDDIVWPTRTFRNTLELTIGGEKFVLKHHRGETDDHLYVWVPGRKLIVSGDFYQGFLPNAGNGKRVQRYPEEWAAALREMADLKPDILLPCHGEAVMGSAVIQEDLFVLAETLQYIVDHTLAGLNAGMRKDQIYESLQLPARLANHPTMKVQYVSAKDISKMVIRQYTGWWDDIPSHWSPAPLESEAREIVALAGGVQNVVARARELAMSDIKLACHLTDWAFLAYPRDPDVQALVIEVYKRRVLDKESNTQEMLNYVDVMAQARQYQLDGGK
jgi:alkyl sulfatase BDS1-like metallo-beta-lactamase superfamily hydrolase